MLAIQRQKFILDYLNEHRTVKRKELMKLLNVSSMTIGRDLKILESQGLVKPTFGGVISVHSLIEEIKYESKKKENLSVKRKIAKESMKLIEDSMTIILDAGTTTYEISNLIKNSNLKNLTILTNDLYIALNLHSLNSIRTIMIGGEISHETASSVGITTIKILEYYNVDISFIGTSSISKDFYITTPNELKDLFKQEIFKKSFKNVLVTDKNKFNKVKFINSIKINKFDFIISDYEFKKSDLKTYGLESKVIKV